jgi:tRNA(fMet)-specific endonuclease VapC
VEVRIALDTNRLADLFRGDGQLAELLASCEEVWIPLVVLGELKAGFFGGTQQGRNEALLRRFLERSTVGILLPTEETAEQYGRLFVQLKRIGSPIPDNDLWIAAQVLEHNLRLVTRDRHFERIPQVALL